MSPSTITQRTTLSDTTATKNRQNGKDTTGNLCNLYKATAEYRMQIRAYRPTPEKNDEGDEVKYTNKFSFVESLRAASCTPRRS